MAEGTALHLRISPEAVAALDLAAAANRTSRNEEARKLIQDGVDVAAQLQAMRRVVEGLSEELHDRTAIGGAGSAAQMGDQDRALLVEVALMLRRLHPGDAKVVHFDLERHGLPVWTGAKA